MIPRPISTALPLGLALLAPALWARPLPQDPVRPVTAAPWELAPDGARGFGPSPTPKQITALMRSDQLADRQFIGGLLESAGQVQFLLACARGRYGERGYFSLLPGSGARAGGLGGDVEVLAQRFGELLQTPLTPFTTEQALAFARMVGDDHFRLRVRVLTGAETDITVLRGAIRIFTAHTYGRAGLEEGSVLEALASHADLGAARLRAMRLDLDALYEPVAGAASEEDTVQVLELAEALIVGDEQRILARLQELDGATRASVGRLEQGLLTKRFDLSHVAALAERKAALEKGERAYREMELLVPFRTTGSIGGRVGGVRATDRYRLAVNSGVEGLGAAPSHAGMNFAMGLSLDFTSGRGVSERYFDRFLALRGLLHWEQRCFTARPLDSREAYAAWVLTGWRSPDLDG